MKFIPLLFAFGVLLLPVFSFSSPLDAEGFQTNDDGSVVIQRPRFENGKRIHAFSSNVPRICESFGLRGYDFGHWFETETIQGESMTFLGSDQPPRGNFARAKVIRWVLCRAQDAGVASLVSKRAAIAQLNLNEFEIQSPAFLGPDGVPLPIASASHFDGVCRLYGFDRYSPRGYVLSELEKHEKRKSRGKLLVSIASGGGIRSFVRPWNRSDFENSGGSGSLKKLKTIICVRGSVFAPKSLLKLASAHLYLSEISKTLDPVWGTIIASIGEWMNSEYPLETWQKEDRGPHAAGRFLILYWLQDFFERYDSDWFRSTVQGRYRDLMESLAREGWADDQSLDPRAGTQNALKLFGLILQKGALPRLDRVEDKIWASEMISRTSLLIAIRDAGLAGAPEFESWIQHWNSGEQIRKSWFQFQSLSDAGRVIDVLGRYIQRCYRN
ncbi:MAG: hypothetical protein KGP28_10960 [Bdellovibrionales bacterium]|nr:hypothetical protein [Bdellovibrionales bacterium]